VLKGVKHTVWLVGFSSVTPMWRTKYKTAVNYLARAPVCHYIVK